MSRENGNAKWVKRGRQRAAVAQALRKPMTTTEICKATRSLSPRIQLRDIWLVLKEMRERGSVICLNPRHVTGKLYALTKRGRRVVKQTFGIEVPQIPQHIDWRKYAQVVRAKARKAVLLALAEMPSDMHATATVIRKRLREKHPMGLNPVIRALKELKRLGLVRSEPASKRGSRTRHFLSKSGAAIARQINA
jgi:Fe2+ or Zn2+ uptake regulation protein